LENIYVGEKLLPEFLGKFGDLIDGLVYECGVG
jgi:hypothetical protein